MSGSASSSATMSTVQAMTTTRFIGSIGMATHLDALGTGDSNNYGNFVADMQYLGVSLVRSGANMDLGGGSAYADEVENAMAAGIKFDLVINSDAESTSTYTAIFDQLEADDPGGIAAIEGPNEVHLPDLPAAAAYMGTLSSSIAADPLLNEVQLYNYTILSYSPVAYTQEGDLDGSVTMGNVHTYSAGLPPNVFDSWYTPVNLGGTPGLNYAVTETGYETASVPLANGYSSGVSDDVQAKYDLDNVFDLIRDGASEVYIDELYDLGTDPANNEDNFGIFNYDGTPKEAAVALHNLTTILSDPGSDASTFTPGSLTYSITGLNSNIDGPALEQDWSFGILNSVAETLPTYGYSMVLQKSDGAFDLAVWQEPEIWDNASDSQLPAPTIPSTITLSQAAASIEVYDPLLGTTPIATYTDTDQITIGVSDHPIIVEIDPFPSSDPTPAGQGQADPALSEQAVTPAQTSASPAANPNAVAAGSGPDTITLVVSEDAFEGDAQFTVAVDGSQIGGVFTTTAQNSLGQQQLFVLSGNFNAGTNAVSVSFLNDAYGGSPSEDRNLYVLGAYENGVASASSDAVFFGDVSQSITVGNPVAGPTVLGSGPDTLALTVAEQALYSGAQFAVSVDGVQVGGTQTAMAIKAIGESQVFDVEGDFGPGAHTVTVTSMNGSFIAGYPLGANALYVTGATIDGTSVANGAMSLTTLPSGSFTFSVPTASGGVQSDPQVGAGPDDLALFVSERAEPSGAQFTVTVDGQQIGGVQTTQADYVTGQTEEFDVEGDFGPGGHNVAINYLNASQSLLVVDRATINGATVANSGVVISNSYGPLGFSFATPEAPGPTAIGNGPDTLALNLSEDYFQGNAQFTIAVDGQQVGGVQTVAAINGDGQSQVFDVLGNFSGTHSVTLNLLNGPAGGNNLYLGGASIDGIAISNSTLTLQGAATSGFSFVH